MIQGYYLSVQVWGLGDIDLSPEAEQAVNVTPKSALSCSRTSSVLEWPWLWALLGLQSSYSCRLQPGCCI